MPDVIPNDSASTQPGFSLPIVAIVWLIVTGLLLAAGSQVVTMRDQERFPNDFELVAADAEAENSVRLTIVNGTFEYDVVSQIANPVEAGTFFSDDTAPVASALFENVPDLVEVTIEPQTITLVYDNDIEPDLMLQRAKRPVINAVMNAGATITGSIAPDAEKTLIFTTSDVEFRYGRYVPALLPEGAQEVYASRVEAENGSELAQFLFEQVTTLEAATLTPDGMTIQYRDGAPENRVIERITTALNDFHPRASLQPNVWLFTIRGSTEKILAIVPLVTGIPLFIYTLAFAIIEIALMIYFRNSNDKIVRPLVRVVGVFLFFWSIFGHEPLWDYLLGLLFLTSRQLVHPNATVIEFTAQHMELVIISSLIIIPAGVIFGILVTRDEFRELLPLVNNLVNSGQTVPTIAIVAFMAPIIGFGFWPAIIALVAYGLLPVVRNTIAGLESVDDFIIDSARGMGMTPTQILLQIELPIASSIIMAGIRTSMVINVGTATLGAFVGSGGLGTPIASGLSMTIDAFILLGAIPAALLAILIDYVLGRIDFVLTPRGLQIEG